MKRLLVALLLLLFAACAPRVKNLDSRGTTVIAFGDSLTAGYGAGEGEDWPTRVSASTSVPIINAGVNGDTTESALERLEDDVLARDPRIVVVGLGGNDYLRGIPLEATEANLRQIVSRIHERRAMVVLLGFRFPSLNANYEAMYERVADEEECLLVERTMKGILTDPKLKSDQIHPNAAGYAVMAERIAGPLKKLVKRADAE
ncbi:MAG TPA: arylesterase [Thermoanaerobaculia bacterium]|nr:arylesterase [Thermoanaerobaculia bacterium]